MDMCIISQNNSSSLPETKNVLGTFSYIPGKSSVLLLFLFFFLRHLEILFPSLNLPLPQGQICCRQKPDIFKYEHTLFRIIRSNEYNCFRLFLRYVHCNVLFSYLYRRILFLISIRIFKLANFLKAPHTPIEPS